MKLKYRTHTITGVHITCSGTQGSPAIVMEFDGSLGATVLPLIL